MPARAVAGLRPLGLDSGVDDAYAIGLTVYSCWERLSQERRLPGWDGQGPECDAMDAKRTLRVRTRRIAVAEAPTS